MSLFTINLLATEWIFIESLRPLSLFLIFTYWGIVILQGRPYVNSSVSLEMQKHLDELIEHKCKQLSKTCNNKGGAIHLEQWMKGQLGNRRSDSPEEEPEPETWTEEELRKRTAELKLSETHIVAPTSNERDDRCEELILSDHDQSPSRSTTTESQVSWA